MAQMRMPDIIPSSWKEFINSISKMSPTGLLAVLSIETYDEKDIDKPPLGIGEYIHLSLSRSDRYPEWDEMRDFVYQCAFFDKEKDVVMLLPPKRNYVNVQKNCFHFYQKRD
jgi:hypothetical protein